MDVWNYLQAVGSLLGILCVMFVIMKLTQVTQGKRFSGDIKVIDRRGLDSGVTLMMVQVKEDRFLMSVANKSVQVLKHYAPGE